MAKRESARLNAQLNNYAAATKNVYRRAGNWPIYAAATGSALAMATGASASLITSGIVLQGYPFNGVSGDVFANTSVQPRGHSASSIKDLSVAGRKVNLFANSGSSAHGPFATLALQPQGHVKIFFTGASSAKNFAIGSSLSGAAAPQAEIVKGFGSGKLFGQFHSGKSGFAGLSITTAAHANVEYGWIELVFTEQGGLPHDLRAIAYAIDTNFNQTLQAGQIDGGIIPEPGTMSLSILAAGALGVTALRRRRKQA